MAPTCDRESLSVNAAAVTAARFLVPALNLTLVVSIARLGGDAVLGRYTVLVTLFAILENVKSLGLTSLLVRDVAAGGADSLAQYASLIRIGLWGAVLCMPVMVGSTLSRAGFHWYDAAVAAVLSLGLLPSAYALANDALFLALGRARISTGVALGENLLRLVCSLLVVYVFHGGMLWLMIVYVAARLLAAVTGGIVLRHHLGLQPTRVSPQVTSAMIRQAPDFLIIFVSPIFLFKMDVILLDFLRGDHAVGIYSAAMRLISVCLILPDGFMTASFASLSALVRAENTRPFQHLIGSTINILSSGLAVIAACGTLFGSVVLRLLYGARFDAATPVLQILGWALIPFAVNRALGDGLVARGYQRTLVKIVAISTASSVALYGILIPRFSYIGAAWAFTASILIFAILSTSYACLKYNVAQRGGPIRALAVCFAGLACTMLHESFLRTALLGVIASAALVGLAVSTTSVLKAVKNDFKPLPTYS